MEHILSSGATVAEIVKQFPVLLKPEISLSFSKDPLLVPITRQINYVHALSTYVVLISISVLSYHLGLGVPKSLDCPTCNLVAVQNIVSLLSLSEQRAK